MTELELKIQHYANEYYNGNELISDAEYDALLEELKRVQPASILLNDIIGDDLKGISKKLKLPMTMGTLQKAHSIDEFKKWFDRHQNSSLICELKCDGNGQLLLYEDGKFVQSISRGNGEYGEDTTLNVSKVQQIVKEIPGFTGCIRGEVVLFDSIFQQFFKDEANPRNTAAGRIKQKSGRDCEKLNFIAYDVLVKEYSHQDISKQESSKLNFLQKAGFQVPLHWETTNFDEIVKLRNDIECFRKQADYGIDGIVVKVNDSQLDDLKKHIPTTQIAFKPEAQMKPTVVRDILWQLSGSQLAPVAVVDPVEIDGATISRASLSNVNIMNKLGVYIGATVFIKRSGMVIPVIDSVLEPKKNAFVVPKMCPTCNEPLTLTDSGFPVCVNKECSSKLKHRFVKMFDVLGIKGTGGAFVENMMNDEKVQNVEDFLKLVLSEDSALDDWAGGINGRKIVKQMKKVLSEPISVSKFLATFDYQGFAEKNLKMIERSLDELYALTAEELLKVQGFAEVSAFSFLQFMSEKREEIESLQKYFNLSNSLTESTQKLSNVLDGLSFCFTGAACMPRSELQRLVEDHGGINKSGVAKGLSYLVTDDVESGSAKNKKAQQLGIPVISSQNFLKLIENSEKCVETSDVSSEKEERVLSAKKKKLKIF